MEKNKSLVVLGSRIKELRNKHHLNQGEFAKKVGISKTSLSGYENGDKNPSILSLLEISKAFDVSIDWLCGADTPKTASSFDNYGDLIRTLTDIATIFSCKINIRLTSNSGVTKAILGDAAFIDISIEDSELFNFFEEWKEIKPLYDKGTISQKFYDSWLAEKIELYKSKPLPDYLFMADEELPF